MCIYTHLKADPTHSYIHFNKMKKKETGGTGRGDHTFYWKESGGARTRHNKVCKVDRVMKFEVNMTHDSGTQ